MARRIAVPDGFHPKEEYQKVKVRQEVPDGYFKGEVKGQAGYPGHRAIWTEPKMAAAASLAGLCQEPLEWFNADMNLCNVTYVIFPHGLIERSVGRTSEILQNIHTLTPA